MNNAQQYWQEYIAALEPEVRKTINDVKAEDRPFLQQCLDGIKAEITEILATTEKAKIKRHLLNIENYQAIMIDHKAIISIRFGNLLLQAITTGLTIAMKAALGVI